MARTGVFDVGGEMSASGNTMLKRIRAIADLKSSTDDGLPDLLYLLIKLSETEFMNGGNRQNLPIISIYN